MVRNIEAQTPTLKSDTPFCRHCLRGAIAGGGVTVAVLSSCAESTEVRPATQRLFFSAFVLCICVFVSGLGFVVADAQAGTTLPLTPVSNKQGTRYRSWMVPADSGVIAAVAKADSSTPAYVSMPADGVSAGEFIELVAQVTEADATPVDAASVLFEWTSADGVTHQQNATTDTQGVARVRRWVSSRERGEKALVVVSVDTVRWRASRYCTFVPK